MQSLLQRALREAGWWWLAEASHSRAALLRIESDKSYAPGFAKAKGKRAQLDTTCRDIRYCRSKHCRPSSPDPNSNTSPGSPISHLLRVPRYYALRLYSSPVLLSPIIPPWTAPRARSPLRELLSDLFDRCTSPPLPPVSSRIYAETACTWLSEQVPASSIRTPTSNTSCNILIVTSP